MKAALIQLRIGAEIKEGLQPEQNESWPNALYVNVVQHLPSRNEFRKHLISPVYNLTIKAF